jgi:hypothetical protein
MMPPRPRERAAFLLLAVVVLVGVSASGWSLDQQYRPPARKEAAEHKGIVRGRVTTADTGLPIQGAVVRISGDGRFTRQATTDAFGQYEFSGVPPGRYMLRATKSAFITTDYGEDPAADTPSGGKQLEIGEETLAEQADIRMPRGGIIEGRVVNQFDEPLAGWSVKALLRVEELAELYLVEPTRPRATDDRGRFRLFSLPPGEYVVAIEPPPGSPAVRSYFPGVADANLAQAVTVGLSSQVSGIDFVAVERR